MRYRYASIMALFAMPLLGLLGLERLWVRGLDKEAKKKLLIVFGSTGGLCLLLWMFAGMFGFTREMETQLPAWFVDALAEDRKSLFRSDAIRSFAFILVVFLAIYFDAPRRISALAFYAFLIFIVTVDLAAVDKRYFTETNYKRSRDNSFFAINQADQEILKDKSQYRVYNLSYLTGSGENPFAEARTSYYHSSIGGYHGAKLRRYAEFYDSCVVRQTEQFVAQANQGNVSFENLSAFNMLNIGVTPTPPANRTMGRSCAISKKKPPAGAFTSRICPSCTLSQKKLETSPTGASCTSAGGPARLIVTR